MGLETKATLFYLAIDGSLSTLGMANEAIKEGLDLVIKCIQTEYQGMDALVTLIIFGEDIYVDQRVRSPEDVELVDLIPTGLTPINSVFKLLLKLIKSDKKNFRVQYREMEIRIILLTDGELINFFDITKRDWTYLRRHTLVLLAADLQDHNWLNQVFKSVISLSGISFDQLKEVI